MDEADFEKLLRVAQHAQGGSLETRLLLERLISELESESELFAPVDQVLEAFLCLSAHGLSGDQLEQACRDFLERSCKADYAVIFNQVFARTAKNLYIPIANNATCLASTEALVPGFWPFGTDYARRRISAAWTSPSVVPANVSELILTYLTDFAKTRASDDGVSRVLDDMLSYGYVDELAYIGISSSQVRGACPATNKARKVRAAEQKLDRSLSEREHALVSFLRDKLREHKTVCLREYNAKEVRRQRATQEHLQRWKDEDEDEYGDIHHRILPQSNTPLLPEVDTSDLKVLKRPYWLFCERGTSRYWIGERSYKDFIISYTSDMARKMRYGKDDTWLRVDLDIVDGRLSSFQWHCPREHSIAVAPGGSDRGQESTQRHVGYTLASIADRLRQEQDAVMRTSPVGITLISGAAGSGKTNIAFHRIDYLLQQQSGHFSRGNIAVFAPKASLALYLEKLAESMYLGSTPVFTYDTWAMQILSAFTDANRVGAEEPAELAERKSSAAMIPLMQRYLSDLRYQVADWLRQDSRLQNYSQTIDGLLADSNTSIVGLYAALKEALGHAIDASHEANSLEVGASRRLVETSVDELLSSHLNDPTLVDRLEDLVTSAFAHFPGFKKEFAAAKPRLEQYRYPPSAAWRSRENPLRQAGLRSTVSALLDKMYTPDAVAGYVKHRINREKNRVNARLRVAFQRSCFTTLYARPPERLKSVCSTPFLVHIFRLVEEFYRTPVCWEYLQLAETPEQRFQVTDLSRSDLDVALWLILHMSIDNLAASPRLPFFHVFDHVVVDEAEDFTPLELRLLHLLSNNSMTLTGDLSQRIFPMGMRDWDDLNEPIDHRYVLTMSHRITLETALFANAVIQAVPSSTVAEKVADHGSVPQVRLAPTEDQAALDAISYVQSVRGQDSKASVLLVHPRNGELHRLRDELTNRGISSYIAKGDTWEFSGKVAITTYRRVQGLEYDYVVVLGLNEFEDMQMLGDKARIFYTLATRARIRLVLCVARKRPALITTIDPSLYEFIDGLNVERTQ